MERLGPITGSDITPAILAPKEGEVRHSIGVVLLIAGLDPKRNGDNTSDPLIWTIVELKNKQETSKIAGQISVPSETRKHEESREDNVLGALAEFCDDTAFSSYVARHLVQMDGQYYREKGILVGGKPVDVVVLIYDGAIDFPFKPVASDEVSPNGWVKKSELQASDNLRSSLRQALELNSGEGLIKSALESYYANPDARKPVISEEVTSIEEFSVRREVGDDVKILPFGYRRVEEKLPEARVHIVSAINSLIELQRLSTEAGRARDFRREDEIVSELERVLRTMDSVDCAVGIDELDGLGIRKTNGGPRAWYIGWKNRERRKYDWLYGPNDDALQNVMETRVQGRSLTGLRRGDRLGYSTELGRDWYLVFGAKSENGERGIYYAPVDGIRDIKLKPYDAYGM